MTSRILFAVLIAALGFSQCLHSTQATFISSDNTDIVPQSGFYKPYIVYRPTSPLQRTIDTFTGLLSGPIQIIMKIISIPLLIIKIILFPIMTIKKIIAFFTSLPLLPFKILYRLLRALLLPIRYIFG